MAAHYNFSIAFTQGLMTTLNILAAVMRVSGITTAYLGLKQNKFFL